MVKLKSIPYITTDDVEELTGKHWGDFEFAQMAENDSYITIKCDDGSLESLYEDAEWFKNKFEDTKLEHTTCQIKVVEYLRSVGYRSDVLMYVHY